MELVSLYKDVRQAAGTGASNWPFYHPLLIDEFGPLVK